MEVAGMHQKNMARNVIAGLQKVLQQEQVLTENPTVIELPVNHVANAVQNTQKQLATQLKKIQAMVQAMQMKYSSGPQNAHQYYEGRGYHSGK